MNFTFKARSEAECKSFLEIREADGEFQTIDIFIQEHPDISESELNNCSIRYRGTEKSVIQVTEEYRVFSESMKFVEVIPQMLVVNPDIKASIYFTQKAGECLQFARFFTMKSALILDTDYNVRWIQGYGPQFLIRCLHFGTAVTWLSNAFDHVLQIVYWGKKLYPDVKDRDEVPYDDSWDDRKIMECCTFEFVVGELKARGQMALRRVLTSCSGLIQEVRQWANYIKHKGGIDYKFLTPESPLELYIYPPEGGAPGETEGMARPKTLNEQYRIRDFKSPIEVDIDEGLGKLVDAHNAIYDCIQAVIADMDFPQYEIKLSWPTK